MPKTLTQAQPAFAQTMVAWQRRHGRQNLPWQNTREPYRVWLSEIMLQQTQVSTVLDYYARFLQNFPDVAALAAASQDQVMGLWSGLGYYSRARNLHQCAKDVVSRFGGQFPSTAAELITLPGIGRSTAAAIAAFCFSERVAILDGNVKRVLTRVLAYEADLSVAAHEKALWILAEALLPTQGLKAAMPRYTQAVMDLGATLCLPKKPVCAQCPVQHLCQGFAQGEPERMPVKTRKLKRSSHALWLLWAVNSKGQVWLEKRADTGIWAGLYCLPVWPSHAELTSALPSAAKQNLLAPWKHVLTHKDLHLHPVKVRLQGTPKFLSAQGQGRWWSAQEWPALGLPAPVRQLLSA